MSKQPDYTISGGGTIYMVTPRTKRALKELKKRVASEAQWMDNSLAVGHRYIENLVEGMTAEGFTFL